MNEAKEFLNAMVPTLPEDQRLILCAFAGDPNAAPPDAWQPRPWQPNAKLGLSANWNAYVTVASFYKAQDRSWRRRKSLFAAGHALMVDDVGRGAGTKVNPADISLPPSAKIETSEGNFQWWYFFDEPETDGARFDALIRAFIDGKLLGMDPGMAGITRVGRLPGFINGKKRCNGFITRLDQLTDRTYSIDELVNHFSLQLKGRNVPLPYVVTEEAFRRNRAFVDIYKFLQERKMLKREEPDLGGWTEMTCPWVEFHTGGIDNGAAIAEPSETNAWTGAFRCHHGHCIGKAWRDLMEWINDIIVEELDAANRSAK